MEHGGKTTERKEAIRSAYRLTGGNSFYDGMITCTTLSGKAVCRLVWAMNKAENDDYLEKALSGTPEHFSGRLLEVLVGTGVLTMYKAFVRAKSGCDKWHDYEMSVAPYENGKPIYYEFTACPAAEFAKQFGFTDIMPALCNVDYASIELLHARLVRTTTCVDGCRCDYTICGDQDPYVKEHPEYRDEAGFRRNK